MTQEPVASAQPSVQQPIVPPPTQSTTVAAPITPSQTPPATLTPPPQSTAANITALLALSRLASAQPSTQQITAAQAANVAPLHKQLQKQQLHPQLQLHKHLHHQFQNQRRKAKERGNPQLSHQLLLPVASNTNHSQLQWITLSIWWRKRMVIYFIIKL
jgi:hypothetical protein